MTLPRRAFLGIELPPEDPFGSGGLRVGGIVPGSIAEAELEPGDIVVRIGDQTIGSPSDLVNALRSVAGKERVVLELLRAGKPERRETHVVRRPVETIDGHRVLLGSVDIEGVQQRTIVTRPSRDGAFPAIVFLQGIGEESIDFSMLSELPFARLVHGLAREGFVTLRVERRGIGDSEPGERTPALEIAAFERAIDRLRAEPWVSKIALFGHSLGGMLAPFVASRADAMIVYGTSGARWLDCVDASTRRQLALRNVAPDEIERRAKAERAAATAYDRALDALDVASAWRRVACPCLVLQGEHDWVVSEEEARSIVDLAGGRARLATLPGVDHAFTTHAHRAESLEHYGRGTFATAIVDVVATFLRREATETRA